MTKLIAYHGQAALKKKYLARIEKHRKADRIIQSWGYWQKDGNKFKGCAVGCTLEKNTDCHAQYEIELGIPRVLACLEDGIFENLPSERAQTWPGEFLQAINPGADLSNVWPQFVVWLLIDKKYGVLQFAPTDESKTAIQNVAHLYKRFDEVSTAQWHTAAAAAAADAAVYAVIYAADAADAADAAACAAAYAADAAACAADSAVYAADYAVIYAADAAAFAAAAADAADAAAFAADAADAAYTADSADSARQNKRLKWRMAQADKLLQLLREAK